MITVVSIQDPFQPDTNVKDIYEYVEGNPLSYYLSHINLEVDDVTFAITVNGVIADNDTPIQDGDIIAVCANIEAAAIAGFIVGVGAGGFAAALNLGIGYAIAYGAIYLAVTFAISYGLSELASALGPDGPDVSSTGSDGAVQQTYGWGDIRQTTGEGNNIPLLFGTNRISGQVINSFVDVQGDKEILNTYLAICDHVVDSITDIEINNQPYTYYKNATPEVRLGTNIDTIIDGFNEIVTQVDIGSKLERNVPLIQQTGGTGVEKLIVQIIAVNGLYYSNDEGGLDAQAAVVDLEYRVVGDLSWIPHSTITLSAASTSTQRTTAVIDSLSPAKYEVRLTRTNPEISSHRGQNAVNFAFLQEIVKEALIYPGLAKYAVKVLATDQLSGSTPKYSALVSRDTVQVWNADTLLWETKRATNPAWICYALLVTYGHINKSKIIWDEFKAWGDFCDEQIDNKNRFDVNVVVYTGNFWGEIQKIAKIGRAAILRRGTRYGVFIDKYESATPIISHLFSMGNIVNGTFQLQYLPKKDRANAVDVEYTDVDRSYSRQVVSVVSNEFIVGGEESQRAKVNIPASVTQAEAVREGVFRINSNKYLNRVITFDAFIDSFAATVGDLFYFQHIIPDYSIGLGGRIIDAGNDYGNGKPYVVIDQFYSFDESKSYSILIRLADGTIVEKVIESIYYPVYSDDWVGYTELWGERYESNWGGMQEGSSILILNSNFSTIPVRFDPYNMGETDSYKKIYRLTSISRQDDFVRKVTGVEYVEEIYSENDSYVIEEPTWIERKPTAIQVNIHEFVSYENDGSYKSNLNISWVRAYSQEAANWTVWLEDTTAGTEPVNVGTAYENSFIVTSDLVLGHTYKAYIAAYEEGAVDTGGNTSTVLIQGKLAPPNDVINFVGIWDSIKRQVHFSWSPVSDIDLKNYEIRQGNDWSSGVVVAQPSGNLASIFIDEGVTASISYRIKAVDTSGIYSENEDISVVVIDTSETPLAQPGALVLATASEITSDGTNVVSITATWNADAEISDFWHHYDLQLEDIATGALSEFSTSSREYRWEVIPNKSYGVTVRAVDISGNSTAWITQEIITSSKDNVAPATPTWPSSDFAIAGFKVIGLDWNDNTEEDLSHYILERSTSPTFANNVIVLGTIDASFHSDSNGLDVLTTYYYRLKAVDSSGNSSGYSAIISATTLEVGTTDIAAGSIIASKISVSDLSAISANIGTITAGRLQNAGNTTYLDLDANTFALGSQLTWDGVNLTIASGSITVGIDDLDSTVINNGKIATGLVVSDSIVANSITGGDIATDTITSNELQADSVTATEISVSELSAISANMGTITAGNIVADLITSGTLNADRLGANTIEAVKLGLGTWKTREDQPSIFKFDYFSDNPVSGSWLEIGQITTTTEQDKMGIETWTEFDPEPNAKVSVGYALSGSGAPVTPLNVYPYTSFGTTKGYYNFQEGFLEDVRYSIALPVNSPGSTYSIYRYVRWSAMRLYIEGFGQRTSSNFET